MTQVQSYDLNITSAISLGIPVIGSGGGTFNRRVVVLEQSAFREALKDGAIVHYGYAVRFCVTVSKWDVNLKPSLPFLAASAELGSISAHWTLQVLGLSGPKINEALLPPTELNVEKFVLAKQSLEKIIVAIQDPRTEFHAEVVGKIDPAEQRVNAQRAAAVETYALSCIERGRSLYEAVRRSGSNGADLGRVEIIRDTYRGRGIEDENVSPSDDARRSAREILGGIRADI
jgi:hypothetical protein